MAELEDLLAAALRELLLCGDGSRPSDPDAALLHRSSDALAAWDAKRHEQVLVGIAALHDKGIA